MLNTSIAYVGRIWPDDMYLEEYHGPDAVICLSLSGDVLRGSKFSISEYVRYTFPEDAHYSTISIIREEMKDDPDSVEYIPNEDDPFLVEILDVSDQPGISFKAIEAKLSGTLYRKDNPEEYITVEAVCGFR